MVSVSNKWLAQMESVLPFEEFKRMEKEKWGEKPEEPQKTIADIIREMAKET